MRAWTIEQYDGIKNAKLTTVPDPAPAPGEALLRMKFAALNPADAYLASGDYPAKPPLPHIVGRDGIGEVVSVGAGVNGIRIGDKKALLRGDVGVTKWGTLAELVTVPVESLIDPPGGWTDQQAASATLVYLTAYQALTQWEDLPAHATVLVSGASGGVGVAATQLGVAMGHTMIGLSRSPEKRRTLESLGMKLTLDPNDSQWQSSLKSAMGKQRVDLAIDNIGGPLFPQLIATLGDHGRVSVIGRLAGEVPSFNTASLFFRRIRIGGVAVGAYTNPEARSAWQQVVNLLEKTGARPLIDEVFAFDQVPKAFDKLARGPMGKVLVNVSR